MVSDYELRTVLLEYYISTASQTSSANDYFALCAGGVCEQRRCACTISGCSRTPMEMEIFLQPSLLLPILFRPYEVLLQHYFTDSSLPCSDSPRRSANEAPAVSSTGRFPSLCTVNCPSCPLHVQGGQRLQCEFQLASSRSPFHTHVDASFQVPYILSGPGNTRAVQAQPFLRLQHWDHGRCLFEICGDLLTVRARMMIHSVSIL